MLRHNLLLFYRNFKRFKNAFLINLVGLATGLACFLLIYLWVKDELSVDKFHINDRQLHQVMKNNTTPQGIETGEDTPGLLARDLREELPEVEQSVSVFPPAEHTFNGILSVADAHSKAKSKFADNDFFTIFSYPLLHGNREEILADKHAVAISEDLAMNLFHTTENVVGKTVTWKGERLEGEFLVSGIFRRLPANATIPFDIVFSYDLMLEKFPNFLKWGNSGPSTYVLLKEDTDVADFNTKIAGFVKSKYEESTLTLFARPYSDRYLYSEYKNGKLLGGRIVYVRLFSIIAVFVLLIACINFMNLSTAKASKRLKEIGIKKVAGARRKTLVAQYLTESVLLTALSMGLGIVLVFLFLPSFNGITGKQITLQFDTRLTLVVFGITLFTGLVAGSYPALYLSAFKPFGILKGGNLPLKNSVKELWARNGLVAFQFVISMVLTVSVLVVYRQMEFIQAKNLGFEKANVISFTSEGKLAEDSETFLTEVRKIPGIAQASYMDGDLTGLHSGTTGVEWDGKDPNQTVDFNLLGVGYELIETLGIEVKEGRSFSHDFGSEQTKVIFNEAAIESMGLTDPVGKNIRLWDEEMQVIGVVKNFHFESLYENIKPFFFRLSDNNRNILVKIKPGALQETLPKLEQFYRTYNLSIPFEYRFLDENYQQLYAAENRVSILSRYFAGIAILISCLGLFGLVAFAAERRTKEIGIRKVLGASVGSVVRLLSRDFIKPVLLAIFIASPISWWAMNSWLEDFAYRIEIQWWMFALAGLAALAIALLTVSWQAVRAAVANPVDSLRDE